MTMRGVIDSNESDPHRNCANIRGFFVSDITNKVEQPEIRTREIWLGNETRKGESMGWQVKVEFVLFEPEDARKRLYFMLSSAVATVVVTIMSNPSSQFS